MPIRGAYDMCWHMGRPLSPSPSHIAESCPPCAPKCRRRLVSPMTNQPMSDASLVPNRILKSAIAEWRARQRARCG
jgi:hypothetical protein